MASRLRCPYDPELQADILLDLHDCPICGCSIFAGLPHGLCTDPRCAYYDEVALAQLRRPVNHKPMIHR